MYMNNNYMYNKYVYNNKYVHVLMSGLTRCKFIDLNKMIFTFCSLIIKILAAAAIK